MAYTKRSPIRRRRYRRRGGRRTMSKPLYKAVRRIANKVVSRRVETKQILYSPSFVSQNGLNNAGVFWNLISTLNGSAGLAQGTSESTRIGDHIGCRGISLRLFLANTPFDGNQPYQIYHNKISIRVVIFSTKDTTVNRASLMDNSAFSFVQTLDTQQNRIIYDRTHYLHTTLNAGLVTNISYSTHKLVKIWIPGVKLGYRGDLQFVDNSATALKGFVPYMAIFAGNQNDGDASAASVMWNGKFYFKDA